MLSMSPEVTVELQKQLMMSRKVIDIRHPLQRFGIMLHSYFCGLKGFLGG